MSAENPNLEESQDNLSSSLPVNPSKKEPTKAELSKYLRLGLIFIAIEMAVFIVSNFRRGTSGEFFDTGAEFFINFILTIIFIAIGVGQKSISLFKNSETIKGGILSLVLMSISCFTLNNAVTLFSEFTI